MHLSKQIMSLLKEATEEKRFDIRIIERNLTRNIISDDELHDVESNLPDDSANAEWVNPEELDDEDAVKNQMVHKQPEYKSFQGNTEYNSIGA